MIDWSRTHHSGYPVADIEEGKRRFGHAMRLDWAPVRRFDPLPFWTPRRGSHEVVVLATYSRTGPHHVELIQGTGDFFDPASGPDARHIGVFVDDLRAEAEHLLAQGWTTVAANAAPEDGFGSIAYLAARDPQFLVELISTDLEPALSEWIAS